MQGTHLSFILAGVLCLLIGACSENGVSGDLPADTTRWNNFSIEQTFYDSVNVRSENQIVVSQQLVETVYLLAEKNGHYTGIDTIKPTYIGNGNRFYLNFDLSGKVPDDVVDAQIRIFYELSNGERVGVDTSAYMLSYPYPEAEIYIEADKLANGTTILKMQLQDFEITGTSVFFHPTGALGTYEYRFADLRAGETVGYNGGNHIAVGDDYLFFEPGGGSQVRRYVRNSGETDLLFDFSSINYLGVFGMDVWQGALFILFWADGGDFIGRFDYDGNLLETIPYPKRGYFMSISDNGILYTTDLSTDLNGVNMIDRFNLNTGEMLESRIHPAISTEGLRVLGANLYYVDYPKRLIVSVPLSVFD
ncbi:MAG: hypothetical protein ACRBF0_06190 [Calditrichia bacterium]